MTKFYQSTQNILRILFFLSMTLFLFTTAVTVKAVFNGGTTEYLPVADASVSAEFPNTNIGSATNLTVNSNPELVSYLRFDVGSYEPIGQAKLQLYVKSNSPTGFVLHVVNQNNWEEMQITYNNAPPVGSAIYTSGAVSAGTIIEIDITSYVTSGSEISLALTGLDANLIKFGSRESGAYAPRLIITGEGPGRCGAGICLPTSGKS